MNNFYDPNQDIFAFLGGNERETSALDEGEVDTVALSRDFMERGSRDAVIFCVDCASLQTLMSGEESQYQRTLATLANFMRRSIVASEGADMTGLVFYNVSNTNNPLRQRGIHLVQPLGGLNARLIQEALDLSRVSLPDFISQFGEPVLDADVSDLLFVCNSQLKRTSAAYTPRILIFTGNDDPPGTNRAARRAALTRANDFRAGMSSGAEITVFPLSGDFDVYKFWSEVVLVARPEDGDSEEARSRFLASAFASFEDLGAVVLQKAFKKRPINRINLFLSDDKSVKVALMMYTSYLQAQKPRQLYIDAATGRRIKSESRYISEQTGAVLNQLSGGEISTYVEFQGLQVPMTREDVGRIKQIEPDTVDAAGVTGCLHLIGFRPKEFLRPDFSVGHSCFLYPQDDRVAGSATLVSALIDRMLNSGVIGIARAVPKHNSTLQFVALIPQDEKLDENGHQELSPGLFVVRLPFADDLRDLTLKDTNVAAIMRNFEEQDKLRMAQVESAKRIVELMTPDVPWKPERLDNFALKTVFRTLERLALNLEAQEEIEDQAQPVPQAMDADRVVPDLLASMSVLDTQSCALSRPADVKRFKAENDKIWTDDEIKQYVATGELSRLTVSDLKTAMSQLDRLKALSSGGKKADLIERITNAYV